MDVSDGEHSSIPNSQMKGCKSRGGDTTTPGRKSRVVSGKFFSRLKSGKWGSYRSGGASSGTHGQLTGQSIPQVSYAIDRFQQLSPPVFRGKASADPSESEYWIEQLEKIFDFIGCEEGERVVCATFMLRDEADHLC